VKRAVLILIVLAIAGLVIWLGMQRLQPEVAVAAPTRGPAVEAVYATGVVEPVRMAKVAPIAAARLSEVLKRDGEKVRRGTPLARLDDREARGNLASLEARRDFLAKERERQRELYEKKFIARAVLERAESDLAQAEATLAAARRPLAETVLVSPIDGIVLRQDGEAGEMVSAGQALFWVGEPHDLRITADIDEEDIPRVAPGQRALIKSDAFPGQALEGSVAEITPKGDSLNKNYRVRMALPHDTPLKTGMTVEVNVIVRKVDDALLVPSTAVVGGRVFALEAGRAAARKVTLGIRGAQLTQITAGLSGGERIIVNPPSDLAEGQRVRARQ
jgi:RND family efflux transporter MFP subunit